MTKSLVEMIECYPYLNYIPVDILEKHSMAEFVKLVDSANGYFYSQEFAESDEEKYEFN